MSVIDINQRRRQVISSMGWAAWADALGFISELTDETGLHRRLRGGPLTEPVEWRRRVGGRFGPDAYLPAGCYSDDTQLRIATGRCISARGFDVDAFSRIELPVWPAYALGGGRATKAAVANLTKANTTWFSNFYPHWTDAGGNGVAMRIQPHVWAASQPATIGPHLVDLFANAITTHGHPRALVGAVLHALALGVALEGGDVPGPELWPTLLDMTDQAVRVFPEHPSVASVWLPTWEAHTGASFFEAWHGAVQECRDMQGAMWHATRSASASTAQDPRSHAYHQIIECLRLRAPDTRGSGTATVVASLALADMFRDAPAEASVCAARAVGTDTDTIGTMTAALVGAATATRPPPVLDGDYLTREAVRLAAIGHGVSEPAFRYPDLLTWVPPKTQLDACGLAEGRPTLAGLTRLAPMRGAEPAEGRDAIWQWMSSEFGPSFLTKQRRELRDLPPGNWPVRQRPGNAQARVGRDRVSTEQLPLEGLSRESQDEVRRADDGPTVASVASTKQRDRGGVDVDTALSWLTQREFSTDAIGHAVRRMAETGTAEQMIALSIALRQAIRAGGARG